MNTSTLTPLLSTKDLASLLGLKTNTVERLRCQGHDLPRHVKLPSGAIRYDPKDVQDWLDKNKHKTAASQLAAA
ncbi:MAG: helix-turn-helix domain-containing protein [Methylotenera sp.]|uniref:helix-turn-helix transcriptional regulator n=1 Tax=Methylotenera sp. TaxID=2051956 RepID=UPI00272872B2|nr:helix-turn-helix domain-containing protein [Methylotenera sp.]MDO9394652.1 helix-turn-helix domain-containing protein [Methylotenera sp.]